MKNKALKSVCVMQLCSICYLWLKCSHLTTFLDYPVVIHFSSITLLFTGGQSKTSWILTGEKFDGNYTVYGFKKINFKMCFSWFFLFVICFQILNNLKSNIKKFYLRVKFCGSLNFVVNDI